MIDAEVLRWNADQANAKNFNEIKELTKKNLYEKILPFLEEKSKNGEYFYRFKLTKPRCSKYENSYSSYALECFDDVDINIVYLMQLLRELKFCCYSYRLPFEYGYLEINWRAKND